MRAAEILNYDNYCALALSVWGEKLICPELAFERLGMNVFHDRADKKRYSISVYGPNLYRDMKALKDDGWKWTDIAEYFGMRDSQTAMTLYCRVRRKYTGIRRRDEE